MDRPCSDREPCDLLLIEDEVSITECFKASVKQCSDCGFNIATAGTLKQGLELLTERPFNVCLLDMGLPDEQGLNTVRRVMAVTKGRVTVVVFTGSVSREMEGEILALGAQAYVAKNSVDFRALISIIRDAVKAHSYVMRWINHCERLQTEIDELKPIEDGKETGAAAINRVRKVRNGLANLITSRA